jgi:hypothetical protein
MRAGTGSVGRDGGFRGAFSLLADETRLDIVEHLRDVEDGPVPYAELKDALGIRDSGRFNYHLRQLRGAFVRKTDGGYVLLSSADALYQAMVATRPMATDPDPVFGIEPPCDGCGSILDVTYEREELVFECPDCETPAFEYPFPPGGFAERTPAEALRAFDRRTRHHISLAQEGVCPHCSGSVEATWLFVLDLPAPIDVLVRYDCTLCGAAIPASVRAMAATRPPVVALFYEHGIDLRETPPWKLHSRVAPDTAIVRSEEPPRVELTARIDGEAFAVLVGRDEGVVAIEA